MRIELDSILPYPCELVFATYRDDMTAFVEYLPNVRRIETLSREEEGAITKLHNIWHGATELPAALAQSLEARFLSWDDYAEWDADARVCSWTIAPRAFRDAVRCEGRTAFIELADDKTRIDMTGELAIDFDRVRGVPGFLAGSLGRTAESFLLRQLTLNLEMMSQAIERYLEEDTVA